MRRPRRRAREHQTAGFSGCYTVAEGALRHGGEVDRETTGVEAHTRESRSGSRRDTPRAGFVEADWTETHVL
jgi:hypothetical protein